MCSYSFKSMVFCCWISMFDSLLIFVECLWTVRSIDHIQLRRTNWFYSPNNKNNNKKTWIKTLPSRSMLLNEVFSFECVKSTLWIWNTITDWTERNAFFAYTHWTQWFYYLFDGRCLEQWINFEWTTSIFLMKIALYMIDGWESHLRTDIIHIRFGSVRCCIQMLGFWNSIRHIRMCRPIPNW